MFSFRLFLHAAVAVVAFVFCCCAFAEDPGREFTLTHDAIFHPLPQGISNNAVAAIQQKDKTFLFSFNGLGAGKRAKDVRDVAFGLVLEDGVVLPLPQVPGDKGRLASGAVEVQKQIYLFGGYTVAADGSEVSTPDAFRFDPQNLSYHALPPMPTPVDDTVALVYQNRYIYLVSGWHNEGNVSAVQVFDTLENRWHQATDFPGTPVFGHAGALVGNTLVIIDGVKVVGEKDGKRQYAMSSENWLGRVDAADFRKIQWERLAAHPGEPRYRVGASEWSEQNLLVFAGGAENPYNFNGIGYNGEPSEPSDAVFAYDTKEQQWLSLGRMSYASMDHRGLLRKDNCFYLLGGMLERQRVSRQLHGFCLQPKDTHSKSGSE